MNRNLLETLGYYFALFVGLVLLGIGLKLQWEYLDDGTSAIAPLVLSVNDLRNPSSLAVEILESKNPLSTYVWSRISGATKNELSAWDKATVPSYSMQSALVNELNAIITGPEIWDNTRFDRVHLRVETKNLKDKKPMGYDLVRLHRLLLEDAFPNEIVKRQTGWSSARGRLIGATLVTLAIVVGTLGTGSIFRDLWLRIADLGRSYKFLKFFGKSAVSDSLRLVHADRKLGAETQMGFGSPSARRAVEVLTGQPSVVKTWIFVVGDITNAISLAAKIVDSESGVSSFMNEQLRKETIRELEKWHIASLMFSESDVLDILGFAREMNHNSIAFSSYIGSRLSDEAKRALAAALNSPELQDEAKRLTVRDMNAVLIGEGIWDPLRFKDVVLREEVIKISQSKSVGGDRLARLNRLLVEDAYPQIFSKEPRAFLKVPESLENALIWELNEIVNGESIWNEERFSNVKLRDETLMLAKTKPKGSELARLNRLLLEDAYPTELWRRFRVSPEGIGKWLCAEDNYAATALTALFARRTSRFPRQVYDSFIEDDAMSFCTVGLGLGFNEFTHFACALTRGRMFRVIFKPSVKREEIADITDEFILPSFEGGGDKHKWVVPVPSIDTDVAIILRIPTKLADGDDYNTQFVVAGRSASGTAVAGAFLATRWERLHKLYKKHNRNPETDALLYILEHKREPRISGSDASKVILSSGAGPFRGTYKALDDREVSTEEKRIHDAIFFDDIAEVKRFASEICEFGYGFYNHNILNRNRRDQEGESKDS